MSFSSPFRQYGTTSILKGFQNVVFGFPKSPKKSLKTPFILFSAIEPDQCKANAETKERPEDCLPPHPHRYSLCHLQLSKVYMIYRLGGFCNVPVKNFIKKCLVFRIILSLYEVTLLVLNGKHKSWPIW